MQLKNHQIGGLPRTAYIPHLYVVATRITVRLNSIGHLSMTISLQCLLSNSMFLENIEEMNPTFFIKSDN